MVINHLLTGMILQVAHVTSSDQTIPTCNYYCKRRVDPSNKPHTKPNKKLHVYKPCKTASPSILDTLFSSNLRCAFLETWGNGSVHRSLWDFLNVHSY